MHVLVGKLLDENKISSYNVLFLKIREICNSLSHKVVFFFEFYLTKNLVVLYQLSKQA